MSDEIADETDNKERIERRETRERGVGGDWHGERKKEGERGGGRRMVSELGLLRRAR